MHKKWILFWDNIDWPTLQQHHKRKRIILLYKSINGLIAFNIPNYFTPISENSPSSNIPLYMHQNGCLYE